MISVGEMLVKFGVFLGLYLFGMGVLVARPATGKLSGPCLRIGTTLLLAGCVFFFIRVEGPMFLGLFGIGFLLTSAGFLLFGPGVARIARRREELLALKRTLQDELRRRGESR